jgi:serine/threonine protein kinase
VRLADLGLMTRGRLGQAHGAGIASAEAVDVGVETRGETEGADKEASEATALVPASANSTTTSASASEPDYEPDFEAVTPEEAALAQRLHLLLLACVPPDADAATLCGTFVGTAAYMAPERVLGHRYGPPSDVYALGLCVLALLLGEHPAQTRWWACVAEMAPNTAAGAFGGDAGEKAGGGDWSGCKHLLDLPDIAEIVRQRVVVEEEEAGAEAEAGKPAARPTAAPAKPPAGTSRRRKLTLAAKTTKPASTSTSTSKHPPQPQPQPPARTRVSGAFMRLLRGCLETDPARRPSALSALRSRPMEAERRGAGNVHCGAGVECVADCAGCAGGAGAGAGSACACRHPLRSLLYSTRDIADATQSLTSTSTSTSTPTTKQWSHTPAAL